MPLKTQRRILYNLSKFQEVDFSKIFSIDDKYCCRKMTKISEKNVDPGKNGINFPETTPYHNFTRAYWCVCLASTPMAFFMLCSSFSVDWLLYDIFFKFFLSVALFHQFLSIKCCWELAQIVLIVSLNAYADIQVSKLLFRGASQNLLPFLSWWKLLLKFYRCHA